MRKHAGTYIKRFFDFLVALIGILLLLPVLVAISVALVLTQGSPVFFCQKRPGYRSSPFTIIKFRTMKDSKGEDGNLLSDEARLTSFGQFLRSTSLDELPELFNVLLGQMSLVGPRPLKMEYLDRYSPEQARRHEVKPGITGWAQVNGRNALTWEQRLKLDVWYVDHQSLWLDAKILLKTIYIVLRREGISAEGHATMPEFMGTGSSQKAQ